MRDALAIYFLASKDMSPPPESAGAVDANADFRERHVEHVGSMRGTANPRVVHFSGNLSVCLTCIWDLNDVFANR